MKLTRLLFCFFALILSASVSFASEDITDLGETGFSCPLEIKTNGEIGRASCRERVCLYV